MVALIFFLYACFMVWLMFGLSKDDAKVEGKLTPYVSVVIAFRNESINLNQLFHCLEEQNYPHEKLEVIFVNDHSTDNGEDILKKRISQSKMNSRIIALDSESGKKNAIELGVTQATNDIIVTVDADCRMSENWLSSMTKSFDSRDTSMVLGPVMLEGNGSFFDQIQMVEFSTLMGITLATANKNKPILSNGANCAFRKSVFLESNPYDKNRSVQTGDDIFLLHSLKKVKQTTVEFCNEEEALVKTSTKTKLTSFLSQRLRWASKTKHYKDLDTFWMGTLLFTVNLSILLIFLNMLLGKVSFEKMCLIFLFKWILDLLFLQKIPLWLRPQRIVFLSLILSTIYPVYSVGIALLSLFYKPKWKGRKI